MPPSWRKCRGVRLTELFEMRGLQALREPATIRLRCAAITQAVSDERSALFRINRSALPACAERVAALMLRRFPDLQIPLHSRWRHFEAGGVDRKAQLDARMAHLSNADAARARIDLTVVSVLLDAGAGSAWRYTDIGTDTGTDTGTDSKAYGRSEGLGVASLRAFAEGRFSATPGDPLRADAAALASLDAAALRAVFQVNPNNMMVGLEGRAGVLVRLGQSLLASANQTLAARPSQLYDRLLAQATPQGTVSATQVLREVLRLTAPIFTASAKVMGQTAGDIWEHRWAGAALPGGAQDVATTGFVPFHKLSQWLAYSLLEPLQWAGLQVTDIDALTGLPEYRNGGLLLDAGVIVPRQPKMLDKSYKPGEEIVVEWRALTVTLLDELATHVRRVLGRSATELPLACILEGGTWAAGRELAQERRPGGEPPLKIDSDGTVF